MARNKKIRVSWAPDSTLCKIRKFSIEDCPSKVGIAADTKMQLKDSHTSQFNISFSKTSSGFSRMHMKKSGKFISIPSIKWKCPPKIQLNPNWLVASGEQSIEVGLQRQRELKVSEAVYHCVTDIPHSPSGALCKGENLADSHITPIIRVTPIEDEETPSDTSPELVISSKIDSPDPPAVSVCQSSGIPNTSQCLNAILKPHARGSQGVNSCDDADIAAAASASLNALLISNEIGSNIDTNLLINILKNPEIISLLLSSSSFDSRKPSPKTNLKQISHSVPSSCPASGVFLSSSASGKLGCPQKPLQPKHVSDTVLSAKAINLPQSNIRPVMATSQNKMKPFSVSVAATPMPSKVGFPAIVKDDNYYKNLIKKYGLDKLDFKGNNISQQSSSDSASLVFGHTKTSPRVSKNFRPCMFHNTPKGCWKGLKCPFQHDTASDRKQGRNVTEVPKAKRMKIGRELTSMF